MSKVKTATREVTILVRYFFKSGASKGNVVLLVSNDKGDRYYVTLARSGNHSCSCAHVPSKKSATCYHIENCRQVENTRAALAAEAKRLSTPVSTVATVATSDVDAELEALLKEVEAQNVAYAATAKLPRAAAVVTGNLTCGSGRRRVGPTDMGTSGQLNGSRAFSLLR
jgi:hypothetical protein